MKLLQACEPLFQYVCRVSRSVRKRAALDVRDVRAEVKALFVELRNRCNADPALAGQYERIELPLLFFVDFIFKTMPDFGEAWQELAFEHDPPELAGDEKFFDLLDETLADRSDAATQRVAVFYTCLGLGFT